MGGRGGASGTRGGGSADGVIMSGATRTIETAIEKQGDGKNLTTKMKSLKQLQTARAT